MLDGNRSEQSKFVEIRDKTRRVIARKKFPQLDMHRIMLGLIRVEWNEPKLQNHMRTVPPSRPMFRKQKRAPLSESNMLWTSQLQDRVSMRADAGRIMFVPDGRGWILDIVLRGSYIQHTDHRFTNQLLNSSVQLGVDIHDNFFITAYEKWNTRGGHLL